MIIIIMIIIIVIIIISIITVLTCVAKYVYCNHVVYILLIKSIYPSRTLLQGFSRSNTFTHVYDWVWFYAKAPPHKIKNRMCITLLHG